MKTEFKNDGVEIAYEKIGLPSNPTLILISGAGAPDRFWNDDFFHGLSENGFQVVRYCHRDTGHSTHFDNNYPITELLSDLKALMEEIGDAPAHLVGHSMGGYLAQLAMCEFPERIASVTSISAGPTVSPEIGKELGIRAASEEVWPKLMEHLPTGNFERDLNSWLENWKFLNGSRPLDISLARDYTKSLYEGDKRNAQVADNHVHAMTTVPDWLVTELRKAKTPFLAVHGSDDPLVPKSNGETSAKLVPAGKFHQIEGAGHMFFDKAVWDELGDVIAGHCRR